MRLAVVTWALLVILPALAVLPADALTLAEHEEFLSGVLNADAARYLRYCPVPLVAYILSSLVFRHLVVVQLCARHVGGQSSGLVRASVHALYSWALIHGGGALLVGSLYATYGGSGAVWSWTWSVAWLGAAAGVPALAIAMLVTMLARSKWVFRIGVSIAMLTMTILSAGWRPEASSLPFPGALDLALWSGRAPLRYPALAVTMAWLALPFAVATWRDLRSGRSAVTAPKAMA